MRNTIQYTYTVGTPKERNLRRRAEIWSKQFRLSFLRSIGGDSNYLGTILEIGAGMGHKLLKTKEVLPKGNVLGIEPSVEMREYAKNLGIKLFPGSITGTGMQDESIDVVHIPQVWHHIPNEDYEGAIQEIKRILKPDGKVVFLDTFMPERPMAKRKIFEIGNRTYAVLSQYPDRSIIVRTFLAVDSLIDPDSYDPKEYGYHSPEKLELIRLLANEGFMHIQKDTHSYGISEMLVFQKENTF